MVRLLLLVSLFFSSLMGNEPYQFKGKHFIASYLECDMRALINLETLLQAMEHAVRASGATILDHTAYVFPPNGLTVVYLLSESHASLHTYPEHGSCFVDLFTCGDNCSAAQFDDVLRTYLNPKMANIRCFLRDDSVQELPLAP